MSEMPSVYGHDRPAARKEHTCCECRGKILVGEKYHKHHGIWDGSADTFKVCDDCESLKDEIDKGEADPEFRTAFQQLYEAVFETQHPPFITLFMDTKRKRGAEIKPWMLERESELTGKKL